MNVFDHTFEFSHFYKYRRLHRSTVLSGYSCTEHITMEHVTVQERMNPITA